MIKKNYIKDFVEKPIKDYWNFTAFSNYGGKSYTYQEVATQIAKFHIMFEKCKVKEGDKIAIIGKNSAHWATVYLATISYGAVIVPILADFHANDIHHIVNHSDSVILFLTDNIWDNVDESKMPNLRTVISLNDFRVLTQRKNERILKTYSKLNSLFVEKFGKDFNQSSIKFKERPNSELGAIVYTSGTTGFSKGVMLPLNSLAANVDFAQRHMPLGAGDKTVSFLPLAHAFGCAFDFLWPFSKGVHIHFLSRVPTPKIILKAFAEIKPAIINAVPLIIEKIYKKQLLPMLQKKSVNIMTKVPGVNSLIYKKIREKLNEAFGGNFSEIILGGAPLSSEVDMFLRKIKFRYTVGYGMTECGPLISYDKWSTTRSSSAGKLIDTLEIKIDSEDPENKIGEIMVKGENVMLGYYKNQEATDAVLDKDGWLHTGDLGVIDKDKYIYIKGRNKSLILGASGENIFPEEIEAIINNMPLVQESVVVGDSKNRLVALIYPDYEEADALNLNDKQIREQLQSLKPVINSNLPRYKHISRIQTYPNEFAKTPKKSIKRYLYNID